MKIKLVIFLMVVFGSTLFLGHAFATSYDYGDATGYGTAYHSNPSWQRLGTLWDRESTQLPVDESDDGVFWSVDSGAYGHADILAGQDVTFRFDMYKEEWGRHATEQLSVWLDWGQDNSFSESGDTIYQTSWDFRADYPASPYDDSFAGVSKSFYFTLTVPDDALGDYWLRARVACNFDVGTLSAFSPTGGIGQGEVEDWKLTVNNPVPEPSTILLLGSGLLGLGWYGRKRKKV